MSDTESDDPPIITNEQFTELKSLVRRQAEFVTRAGGVKPSITTKYMLAMTLQYLVEGAKAHLSMLKLSKVIARKCLEEKQQNESLEIALKALQTLQNESDIARNALERIHALQPTKQ